MFGKLLIANRGEIACRIIRTARKMGIRTVAVYSEADTNAVHASMADEAYHIGPSSSVESYLSIPRLMEAVNVSGAEAVHPGFGFLSENAGFVEAIRKEGVLFVGPDVPAIKAMGDKIEAKKLALAAGVNTVPGYSGVIEDAEHALRIAEEIGFPVMVKAAAGGGGKGMRVVRDASALKDAYISAGNEARNSFADARVFIEKYIDKPRHIEIQIIADRHGNVVCLGERECSIQRNHQKVIEEAPSPFIDEETRQTMYAQCVALAKEVGYVSAGTVEFIVDGDRNFYFLEMNTRLQVEHPVTEMITGTDIVELMLRIAAGEKLPFTQEDVTLKGHALECRIYAEDPMRRFLPSSGRISEYKEPEAGRYVRIDSGVYEGGEVSMFYDPMIAKLITYGDNRNEAVARMRDALAAYIIRGIAHNITFLETLIRNEKFLEGDIHTRFIEETYPDGFSGNRLDSSAKRVLLAIAVHAFMQDAYRAAGISGKLPGRNRHIGNRWVVTIDGEHYPVTVRPQDNGYDIKQESDLIPVRSSWVLGSRLFHGYVDGKPVYAQIEPLAGGYAVTFEGACTKIGIRSPRVAELEKYMKPPKDTGDSKAVKAPISGRIVSFKVEEGETVEPGQELLVLEAMKMENLICAERAGTVKTLRAEPGQAVAYEDLLLEYA